MSDQSEYSRRKQYQKAEIGPLPAVECQSRKDACRFDLLLFLVWYFPESTGLGPLSADHIEMIDEIEHAIIHGGRSARAVFRGFAKTTVGENACLWATLYGHKRFLPLVGADKEAAELNIASIKTELSSNDRLLADFPEVCHPVRALEGRAQRCHSQTLNGELTHIKWTADRLVYPTVPGSPASGACLFTTSIMAFNRGLKHKLHTGENIRPDFVFIDDPQTDASASTDGQVEKREAKINNTILKSAGHATPMSVFVAGTIIRNGCLMDRLTDRERSPAWRGKTVPMVKQWAKSHDTLWLGQYAAIRRDFDRNVLDDQEQAKARALEFYIANRDAMDEGCEVTWQNCYSTQQHEVSAIQHAYNMLIDDGEEAFASECQNAPLKAKSDLELISSHDLEKKQSPYKRREVPPDVEYLTAFVDVQGKALYWVVCGWSHNFTGYVLDYGTWPEQKNRNFRLATLNKTLAKQYRTQELGASLQVGLQELFANELSRDWGRTDGVTLRLAAAAIDVNWHESADAVLAFCHGARSYGFPVLPAAGQPIPASKAPMSEWKRHPGQRHGDCWILSKGKGQGVRKLLHDANAWKTRLARALALPHGATGAISLYKAAGSHHRGFAAQVVAEIPKKTEGNGRTVFQWTNPPGADNHFLDCVSGCMVLASMAGAKRSGEAPRRTRKRRRVSYA